MPGQPFCFIADFGSGNTVDFQKLAAATSNGAKCEAVILRATRSTCEVDSAFASRFTAAGNAGFLVGAYAFNTGEPPAVQANRFLQATQNCGAIFRALDFEHNPSGGQMSLADAIAFLDQVGQATGHRPWLYSGNQIKSLIVNATGAQRDFLSQCGLWGCEYGPKWKNVDTSGKTLPWPTATIWQYTGDGTAGPANLPTTLNGLQNGADLSIFQGTRDGSSQDLGRRPYRSAGCSRCCRATVGGWADSFLTAKPRFEPSLHGDSRCGRGRSAARRAMGNTSIRHGTRRRISSMTMELSASLSPWRMQASSTSA